MPLAPMPPQEIIDALLLGTGARWQGPTITFSFPTADSTWPGYSAGAGPMFWMGTEPFSSGYLPLTAAQAADVRTILQAFEAVIPIRFVETNDVTSPGQIRIAFSDLRNSFPYAFAPPAPGAAVTPIAGDVWLNHTFADMSLEPGYGWDSAGRLHYQWPDLIRAIEGALGFGLHSFRDEVELPTAYKSFIFTAQTTSWGKQASFFSAGTYNGAPLLFEDGHVPLIAGPTVFDILALQSLYGANPATNTGDDFYTADDTDTRITTVYDAGGIDSINASNVSRPSIIDLTPGAYSSIGIFSAADQIAHWARLLPAYASEIAERILRAQTRGDLYMWENNLGIAYSTTIENAAGGAGSDTITGNAAANLLTGGAGADRMFGLGGDDTLSGEDGNDDLRAGDGSDHLLGGAGDDTIDGGAGADTLYGGSGADKVEGGAGANYLRGESGDDTLTGGDVFDDMHGNQGHDWLWGADGDDWVVGGQDEDHLYGEAGADLVLGNLGADTCDGGDGADIIRGGQGDDSLAGGAGADWLSGDRGNDTLTGGAGADIFHIFAESGMDWVRDFNAIEGDRVYLLPGSQYTAYQFGADTVVDVVGADGATGRMMLVGVQLSTLTGGWIFGV